VLEQQHSRPAGEFERGLDSGYYAAE
jgi:hypothetical protein